jgi:hypothetical protein
MMKVMRFAALALLPALVIGCGKSAKEIVADTPEGTVKAFVAAMQKGDVKAAASAYAYSSEAKTINPDWGDIPPGQQTQIIHKLQADKADKLAADKAKYKGDVQVGAAQIQSGQASVTVTAGGEQIPLQLVQEDGMWRISGSQ